MGTADNLHEYSAIGPAGIHRGIEQYLGGIWPQCGRRDKSRNQVRHQRFSRRPDWFVAAARHSGASAGYHFESAHAGSVGGNQWYRFWADHQ